MVIADSRNLPRACPRRAARVCANGKRRMVQFRCTQAIDRLQCAPQIINALPPVTQEQRGLGPVARLRKSYSTQPMTHTEPLLQENGEQAI